MTVSIDFVNGKKIVLDRKQSYNLKIHHIEDGSNVDGKVPVLVIYENDEDSTGRIFPLNNIISFGEEFPRKNNEEVSIKNV